jgi:hypothetical protein
MLFFSNFIDQKVFFYIFNWRRSFFVSSLLFFSFPLFSSNFFVCLSPLHLHRRQHDMFNFLGRLGLPSVYSRSFLPSSFVRSFCLYVFHFIWSQWHFNIKGSNRGRWRRLFLFSSLSVPLSVCRLPMNLTHRSCSTFYLLDTYCCCCHRSQRRRCDFHIHAFFDSRFASNVLFLLRCWSTFACHYILLKLF